MSTVTPNFNWPVPTSTDLVRDGATAIEALGDSIDASLVDLKGGTTGQVLSKNSNTDMDFVWVTDAAGDITGVTAGTGISGGGTSGTVTVTNSMATTIDAKGDLVPGTGADTFARLAVGANGTVLTADSAETTGLKWATPPSGGQTLISTTSLSGVATTISSIPQTYKDLKLVIVSFAPNNADKLRVTVNGGTVCGYTGQYVEGSAPTTTVNYSEAGNGVGYATVTGVNCRTAGGGGNSTHSATVIFYDYTNATDQKNGIFISNALTTSNYAQLSEGGFYTSNTAATTDIKIQWNGTNTFSAGTAYLYGVA